jgi:hypothetical protein
VAPLVRPAAAALVAAWLGADAALAQAPAALSFSVGPARYETRATTSAGTQRRSGVGLSGEGTGAAGFLLLRLRYAEAALELPPGETARRMLVEGEAMLGLRTTPWLVLWAGPHARAYTGESGDSTERWLLWEFRAETRAALLAEAIEAFFESWGVAAASLDVPEPFDKGFGAEGGLSVRLVGQALWGRLGYRVEQTRLAAGERRETTEVVSLWLRLAL